MITGTTRLLGIIGDPIEHSLSPPVYNSALEHLELDYVYVPFPVAVSNLKQALDGLAAVGVVGFNVTIPHKQAIMPLLDEISPVAEAIGAVNTVWRTEEGWYGTNTDVIGFVAPLEALNRDWSQVTPVVLGNGDSARVVVAGLKDLGCPEINIVGQNMDRLAQFWQSWQNTPEIASLMRIHYWENLAGLIPQADLLINTTPIGMYPQVDASPISADLMTRMRENTIAYDLIHNPSPTQFLSLAQANGAIAIDGLEMLNQKCAADIEIWTQQLD